MIRYIITQDSVGDFQATTESNYFAKVANAREKWEFKKAYGFTEVQKVIDYMALYFKLDPKQLFSFIHTKIEEHPLRECYMVRNITFPEIPPYFGTLEECFKAQRYAEKNSIDRQKQIRKDPEN